MLVFGPDYLFPVAIQERQNIYSELLRSRIRESTERNLPGTESESLVGGDGHRIYCWVMEHKFDVPAGGSGTQRFWISQRTNEVLKEEDQLPTGYRYKLKIGISGVK